MEQNETVNDSPAESGELSRRAVLTAMGGVGLTVGAVAGGVVLAGGSADATATPVAGTSRPACALTPETIEGPYYLLSPYKDNTVARVKLDDDFIYQQADSGLLTIRPLHRGRIERGLVATITVGIDPAATPAAS